MASGRSKGEIGTAADSKVTLHTFGGLWTEKKLKALQGYLDAYRRIFQGGRASYFRTTYVDGFAGSGDRVDTETAGENRATLDLFGAPGEPASPKKGSARVALDLRSPFDAYLFVEQNPGRAEQLASMIANEYPSLRSRCRVELADANEVIRAWCDRTDWTENRAVVFLDPYGMSVEWTTIERIARTKAIDLFILFPLGAGLNRMLTRGKRPPEDWARKITEILGTDTWEKIFYEELVQQGLFGEEVRTVVKTATFASMRAFFLERLSTVFDSVAPQAMALTNSTGNPMYLLCFAGGSKRGAPIAVRIASHLLKA